jgi:hypothetical protein
MESAITTHQWASQDLCRNISIQSHAYLFLHKKPVITVSSSFLMMKNYDFPLQRVGDLHNPKARYGHDVTVCVFWVLVMCVIASLHWHYEELISHSGTRWTEDEWYFPSHCGLLGESILGGHRRFERTCASIFRVKDCGDKTYGIQLKPKTSHITAATSTVTRDLSPLFTKLANILTTTDPLSVELISNVCISAWRWS